MQRDTDNRVSLGCATHTFSSLPLGAALYEIAAAGLRVIDLGMISDFCLHVDPQHATAVDLEALRRSLDVAGMRVASCNVWTLSHLNDPGDEERRHVSASIRVAAALGSTLVTVQGGREVPEADWADAAGVVAAELRRLASEAEDVGLRLVVEAPHRGTLGFPYETACSLFDRLDDRIGVLVDTSHVRVAGGQPSEMIRQFGSRIAHVHLRDHADGNSKVTPGDGDVDFAAVAEALDEIDYRGSCCIELEFRKPSVEEARRELGRSVAHLRGLFSTSPA